MKKLSELVFVLFSIAGALIFAGVVYNSWGVIQPKVQGQFNGAEWKNAGPLASERTGMIEDLMENHLTAGVTEETVLELLGEPNYKDGNCVYYNIGFYSQIIDPDSLLVCYTVTRKLDTFTIHHH